MIVRGTVILDRDGIPRSFLDFDVNVIDGVISHPSCGLQKTSKRRAAPAPYLQGVDDLLGSDLKRNLANGLSFAGCRQNIGKIEELPMTDEDYDADRQISWPDLTAYGLLLKHCIFPSGKRMLAIRPRTSGSGGIHQIMMPFGDRLLGVGFVAHPSGVWLGSGTDITTIPWKRHFPNVTFEMRTLGEMTEDMREPSDRQPGPPSP